jgi:hypothetical protein
MKSGTEMFPEWAGIIHSDVILTGELLLNAKEA